MTHVVRGLINENASFRSKKEKKKQKKTEKKKGGKTEGRERAR